ncbi:DUF4890 domain-containing protein [Mongoliitalea daihaiensis]|uniref:DUF4890 domain-containing protein n=1 Tax=Mongoliitalea daihaiensis TaxID=2782006 RepID=UPI001F2C0ADD|nr:DUF4890 domain-containing protein [Mongoliitalea daihaiensis]UJP65667.1 DUF4890 domain-containing protein [Mongoliitalea daihaiensis]
MNKLVLIAAMLLFSFAGYAQRGQGAAQTPEERAKRMTERLATSLELSAEQKEAIYAINLKHAGERQGQVEKRQQEREQQRKGMMEQRSTQQEEIEQLLTPDQQKKWEEMRAQNQGNRGEGPRMQNRRGGTEDGQYMRNRRGGPKEGDGKQRRGGKQGENKKDKPTRELNPIMN